MTAACEANGRVRTRTRPAIRLLVMLIVAAVVVAGGVWIIDPPKYRSRHSPMSSRPIPEHPSSFAKKEFRRRS